MPPPTASQVADRVLVLYAVTRRGAIELVVNETGGDPGRVAQAERARSENDAWLERESLMDALTPTERSLFAARSGTWPREAINDAMWRKEAMGVLLWGLHHLDAMPPFGREFDQNELDGVITGYGSVSSFRSNGALRELNEVSEQWLEADAWFGATEGRIGEDAAFASIAAERFRALSWFRDASAAPA
jgi:hypothetical protein